MNAIDDSSLGPLRLHDIYVEELRVHAVTLIWLGHAQLDASLFASAEEDVITGELVKAMKQVMQEPTSPEWADRYIVQEQVPQNIDGKQGKRRPKMDIEVERHGRGERPKLGFEAKRLRQSNGLRDYLGDEGMTAFLSGYYPTTHGEAGMLGYVQELNLQRWSDRLGNELKKGSSKYRVVTGTNFETSRDRSEATWHTSRHFDLNGNLLNLIHILIPFC